MSSGSMGRGRASTALSWIFWGAWVLLFVGIAAVRWSWLPVGPGLLLVSSTAAVLTVYGLLVSPVVFYKTLFRKHLGGNTLTRCLLGLLPIVIFLLSVGIEGLQAPAIHDITTDVENPPQFILTANHRDKADHPVNYEGEIIARLQQRAYPDIASRNYELSPEVMKAVVLAAIDELEWRNLGVADLDGGGFRVEAVDQSFLFGFEDDVVIRVLSRENGSKLDVRSASRLGLGDLGANARRIRQLFETLEENS